MRGDADRCRRDCAAHPGHSAPSLPDADDALLLQMEHTPVRARGDGVRDRNLPRPRLLWCRTGTSASLTVSPEVLPSCPASCTIRRGRAKFRRGLYTSMGGRGEPTTAEPATRTFSGERCSCGAGDSRAAVPPAVAAPLVASPPSFLAPLLYGTHVTRRCRRASTIRPRQMSAPTALHTPTTAI